MSKIIMHLTKGIALLIVGIYLYGCETTMYLTPQATWNRNIELKELPREKTLIISGLCSHSSWGIDSLKTNKNGSDLFLRIFLKPRKRGDFKFEIKIDNDVDKVYWENTLIWEREKGLIPIVES